MVVLPEGGELLNVTTHMRLLAEIPFFFSDVFPWVFVWAGGCFACDGVREIRRVCASKHWPTVIGAIVETRIETTGIGDEYSREMFTPIVEFLFTFDGVERISSKVAMCPNYPGSRKDAEAVLNRYKVGSFVRIFCSPHDAETAILEPGLRWPQVSKLILGLVFLTAGVGMLLAFSKI